MLETFYDTFGFAGAFITSFLLFICIIFWIAGLAGISMIEESDTSKTIRLTLAILIPVYPLFWMIKDMIVQKIDIQQK